MAERVGNEFVFDGQAADPVLLPIRFPRPSALAFVFYAVAVAFFVVSMRNTDFSLTGFVDGFPYIVDLVSEMFPPSLRRIDAVALSLLETLQMALVGTVFGVLFSLVLGILASKSQTPNKVLYYVSRNVIALFRTVPDLIWALFFVIMVGLGPFAGTLAIMIDTIGFCGRFFAEEMEEVDKGPQEALEALGASRIGTVFCAVIPAALPSFVNTALFSLEKATRSSVVLGLVGAGGIGIELKVSMDMFMYSEASTIILLIFGLVLVVEQFSSRLRKMII
ncbi:MULTISPECIES: phosphonate ABC transporter, permease protein PhnE [unclassified Pseudodesulfovibrio]|uniref:phosphonate ABC transporter, permease protein PhnE n=1 Tax=unclassified Pseudodesulfovibrio TaxID=2661612 RepID=UPI000FEBEE96|nr:MULTISPECIES: phosphonate ABC transporter, permease protein PhnE [unclassified Pseudodesulfovibrio]MCJ2163202.1 phosphonate ABC transporter, permease protein PhnE [Pseudodesulfovibrio sp. S3-i]RWU07186.1 phosphonate ABC transporter, permease protein PhnE [Pseudodesulfovibrio sp. S3]